MLIMYLLGMLFHPANVSSLTFALEVKSCSALCENTILPILSFKNTQRTEQDLTQSEKVRDETFTG